MRFLPLAVVLVLLWAAALAGAGWLGLTSLADPRVVDAPPRLVLRADGSREAGAEALREALRGAGMHADGTAWRLAGDPDRFAIELRAEDARSLARLPAGVRVTRLGGEAAIVLAVPDRGAATRQLVLPLALSRLEEFAREIGAEVVARSRRRQDAMLELQWLLARHPRGRAAPDVRPPRLEAPQLPSGRGAAGGGR